MIHSFFFSFFLTTDIRNENEKTPFQVEDNKNDWAIKYAYYILKYPASSDDIRESLVISNCTGMLYLLVDY